MWRLIIFALFKSKTHKAILRYRETAFHQESRLRTNRMVKLTRLLHHAQTHSPYYKEILQNIVLNDIADLRKVPPLTKDILRSRGQDIASKQLSDLQASYKNSTSGSTGRKTKFLSDMRDNRYARAIRGDEFVLGYRFLDKQLIFWGAERDILQSTTLRSLFTRYILQTKVVSTYHMTDDDIKAYLDLIDSYKPKTIVGYPSALYHIACKIKEFSRPLKHVPLGVISAGEALQLHQRTGIEEAFGCKVYNRYGCREVGHIANECCEFNGLHYNFDDLIIEILDERDEVVADGESGEIAITDLNNYAFPLIRYKIGDVGSKMTQHTCSCGSTLPKIHNLDGRTFDVIHGLNGNKVSGSFWTLLFRFKVCGVSTFQVWQASNYDITLTLETTSHFNEEQRDRTRALIAEKLGDSIKITFQENVDFTFSDAGKLMWIYSELNAKPQ